MTVQLAGWVPDPDTFGARLALVRQRMGWNIKEAALACGQPQTSWRNWERGGRLPRTYPVICAAISERTGCSYDWLFSGGSPTGPGVSVGWGDSVLFMVARHPGGMRELVTRIGLEVGPHIGSRVSFRRMLDVPDVAELDAKNKFRAWCLLAAMGETPSDWGLGDEVVPPAYGGADHLLPHLDSNQEPLD